jgi:hypothetical protein
MRLGAYIMKNRGQYKAAALAVSAWGHARVVGLADHEIDRDETDGAEGIIFWPNGSLHVRADM